jgi:hypothetical protein
MQRELEAKFADRPYTALDGTQLRRIDPHHLTNALWDLVSEGIVEPVTGETRGGSEQTVFGLRNRHATRRQTKFDQAARRKRLLHARYQSWAQTTSHSPNLIGKGGEATLHSSLKEAAARLDATPTTRCILLKPNGGEVKQLFNEDVPSGPLDSAAYLYLLDNGMPRHLTMLIEVKNVRHWLFTDDAEIFQLVEKAVRLQIAHPTELFVPVIVCRQRQYLTHTMAKDLDFFVVPMEVQPMLPHDSVTDEHFNEVCDELGYNLVRTSGPLPRLVAALELEIPKYAVYNALKWQEAAFVLETILPTLQRLRDKGLSLSARESGMQILRRVAANYLGCTGEWLGDLEELEESEGDT